MYLLAAAQHELGLEVASQGNDGHSSCYDQSHFPAGNECNDVGRYQRHQVLEQQPQLVSNCTSDAGCVHSQPTGQGTALVFLTIKPAHLLQMNERSELSRAAAAMA